ncbi:MAG: SMI1/KNR4 family protein [Megamonas funiformis]|uniref:SMI1/KNR4 family protein n=1 Tax=Megamonas funiformis TaxID=437897 RepID=UPI002A7FAFDF|nr:SMI1/KNR4 family protein [Megamonas funiformis]MDY3874895.1 SMI1/KNR4 family protein [Megamonas funiformis]
MWKYVKDLQDKNSVETFLQEHNIDLSDELIKQLKQNNGGRPSPNTIILKNGQEKVFQSLISYNEYDFVNIYDIYPLFEDSSLYPIGIDPAGNFICVEKNKSKKFIWLNHETGKQEEIINLNELDC